MHLRPDHAVTDLPTLHAFIRSHPLGVLTTSLPSDNFPTLQCSHIPWVLDGVENDAETSEAHPGLSSKDVASNGGNSMACNGNGQTEGTKGRSTLGTLRGHIARANPHTKALIEAVRGAEQADPLTGPNSADGDGDGDGQGQGQGQGRLRGQELSFDKQVQAQILPEEVLIVFTSPVDHYITPQFYSASVGSRKVAPTWNYAAVQVYGRMKVYHDTKTENTEEFLTNQLGDLARLGEEGIMGYGASRDGSEMDESGQGKSPWRMVDAPVEYISMLKKGIVGMEVEISRVEGRFKGSQEKGVEDRRGWIGGLEEMGGVKARQMADFVRECSSMK
ncbi:FMN-binding split barrel-related protein [Penicillium hetheringtonii]|uniref:FMN-binding split barrel-related protein n=1 Tax=Penicillium hetheringtonii TaxID=911720 RepID=A0AAD6DFA8_9EURO|nr:FMN-binding split barrel-related protein [Penicillium hetheringtonii]